MERKRQRELRDLNLRTWDGQRGMATITERHEPTSHELRQTDLFPVHGSLDSSLKKNTTFIKRLRTGINPAGQATLLQELRTLSLHKYLSEIITACYEGICKLKTPGEIAVGIEAVSALHQRFGPEEFTSFLGWYIGRGLTSPDRAALKSLSPEARDKEERERVSRQRVLLRVATDLWLVGVLKSLDDVARPEEASKGKDTAKTPDHASRRLAALQKDQRDPEPFPLEALKDLLGHDREHVNLTLVVVFVKTFSWDILGIRPARSGSRADVGEDGSTSIDKQASEPTSEAEDTSIEDAPLIDTALQQRFKNILSRYFEDVKAHVVRDQKQLNSQSRRNAEAYVKSGEVFEDRQATYEKQVKSQEKLVANAQVLASALGVDMPDLAEQEASSSGADGGIGLVKTGEYLRGQGEGAGIWEDEDERRFYENLVDLRERVPGILLDDPKKKKDEAGNDVQKPEDQTTSSTSTASETDIKPEASEDATTSISNKTVGAQVDALLASLPDLVTRDQTDQFAIDFCFLNSKASRNRLIKAIQEVPKGRIDLLPLYSRVVATLTKDLPDITQGVINQLDEEFRSLQRRKTKDFLGQVRLTNIRYIAELTKFGVVPEHVVFHCLKVCLDDFSRMNIEIIANLLENCGRYLLRNSETSPRMTSFLDTLQRKKSSQHLGQQERMLVENAMYYVNPPERAAIQQKERDPLELYIRQLVYLDLSKRTLEKTTKQIRKLHWEEAEVPAMLRKIFTKPGKIKFSNVHLLAVILSALNRYHQGFAISVLDELLEKITVGLETNDFKLNQKRTAEIKYLGELYTYRMVDSSLIFDTLYKLLNFGHPGGHVRPGSFPAIDLPDDFFRVRLVCALLETCGTYFDKGVVRRKLDFFLTYLEYYVHTKESMPMDIEFLMQDTFALLRPQWKVAADLEEAGLKFAVACKQNYQNNVAIKEVETEDAEESGPSEDGLDDGEDDEPALHRESASESEGEEQGQTTDVEDSEDEQIIVTRPEEQRDPEADAEFDRELAKLMSESVDSRKNDRKQVFDVPLPHRRNLPGAVAPMASTPAEQGSKGPVEAPSSSTMKFALLSRKGNKQQTRAIDMPADSNFAVALRTQQEAEKAEQQRIKSLVLNYDLNVSDDTTHDGTNDPSYPLLQPNMNRSRPVRCQTTHRGGPDDDNDDDDDANAFNESNDRDDARRSSATTAAAHRQQGGGRQASSHNGKAATAADPPKTHAAQLRERENRRHDDTAPRTEQQRRWPPPCR